MTSCFTSRSIAAMRSTSQRPRVRTACAAAAGIAPTSAWASQAWASISNQMRYLFSGAQIRVISGRL